MFIAPRHLGIWALRRSATAARNSSFENYVSPLTGRGRIVGSLFYKHFAARGEDN